MRPLELKEMLSEIKSENSEINRCITLVDDSDLADFMSDVSPSNNMLLVGVIPSYGHKGNISSFKMLPVFQLQVLEKTDYSALNNDAFVLLFERTLIVAEKVRDFVFDKIEDGCYPMLSGLSLGNIEIDPVRAKTSCNGWSIDFFTE
ncbi:hypothetical protein ACVVIH_06875 [Chryseobacterium arthrosphaerae]